MNLDRVVRLLGELPESFRAAFNNVVEQLGLQDEWRQASAAVSVSDDRK